MVFGLAPLAAQAESTLSYNYPATDNPSDRASEQRQTSRASGSTKLTPQESSPQSWDAECPTTIRCVVVPAAYSANNGDVGDYGNYDVTNRPVDMAIDKIIIHETEGELQSVLDLFRSSTAYASCHYVINVDGTVYQMVRLKDLPWHAGNWWFNMHSACIEVIGYAAKGSFTEPQYRSTSEVVKYVGKRYSIPLDRAHVLGHDNVPATTQAGIANMHTDMGPYWNWQKLMDRTGQYASTSGQSFTTTSKFMTLSVRIAPVWPLHKEEVTGCTNGVVPPSCTPAGKQPVSFVYLRSAPVSNAPLFTDPILGQGTTDINNNAARLFWGQAFATTGYKLDSGGVWLQINVNGSSAWFYSPWAAPTAFPDAGSAYVSSKGSQPVPTFGRPIPERSEYPADLLAVPPASWFVPAPSALGYELKAGQKYKVLNLNPPTEHFYAWAIDSSFPYDHQMFYGKKKYVEIELGGRRAFVAAESVQVIS